MNEQMNTLVPIVVEQTGMGERSYDIFSRLLKDRIVFLDGVINDATADLVIAQLLYLVSQDPERDINLYINSPGGSVTAGLAIYDTIQYITPDVHTICVGQAASMAAVLLSAGTRGQTLWPPIVAYSRAPAMGRRSGTGKRHWYTGTRDRAPEKDAHRLLRQTYR